MIDVCSISTWLHRGSLNYGRITVRREHAHTLLVPFDAQPYVSHWLPWMSRQIMSEIPCSASQLSNKHKVLMLADLHTAQPAGWFGSTLYSDINDCYM